MAYTQIADTIVPQEFLPYIVERTAELSEFYQSGIIDVDPAFAGLAAEGGQTVVMPFWQDLQGVDQVITDTGALTTKKIGAISDVAVIHNRADAWSTHDLAKYMSGDDPMGRIADLVGGYWARKHQAQLIAMLQGIFGAATMSGNILTVSSADATVTEAETLNGVNFINAKQKLGDAKDKLTAIAMHSAVEASLLKLDLIDFVPVTDARQRVRQFMGVDVIIDDGMPTAVVNGALEYTSVMFGRGALALGVSPTNEALRGDRGTWQMEFDRVSLSHQDIMINRRRYILHARGVKWLGTTMAGPSPSNAELALTTNWSRVYEAKNVRMVAVKHNVLL